MRLELADGTQLPVIIGCSTKLRPGYIRSKTAFSGRALIRRFRSATHA